MYFVNAIVNDSVLAMENRKHQLSSFVIHEMIPCHNKLGRESVAEDGRKMKTWDESLPDNDVTDMYSTLKIEVMADKEVYSKMGKLPSNLQIALTLLCSGSNLLKWN